MTGYDAIVIGAEHNRLTTAVLQRAGPGPRVWTLTCPAGDGLHSGAVRQATGSTDAGSGGSRPPSAVACPVEPGQLARRSIWR